MDSINFLALLAKKIKLFYKKSKDCMTRCELGQVLKVPKLGELNTFYAAIFYMIREWYDFAYIFFGK